MIIKTSEVIVTLELVDTNIDAIIINKKHFKH
jgi:hypothetical protein